MLSPVVAWDLMVRDLRKQQSFYSQVFDWEITGQPGQNWVMVQTGMAEGTITQGTPPSSDLVLAIQVDDVAAMVDKAIRLGARVVYPPGATPDGGMIAMIRDPEGNLVWLSKALAQA